MAEGPSVLKLVHPGGHVETHHSPVRASEVMDKNPRHFVTRPDVFKFPWIVVRPESVLNLGRVFYIVPCRTLYRLLRERRSSPLPMMAMSDTLLGAIAGSSSDSGKFTKSCLKKPSRGSSEPRGHRVMFCLPDYRDDEERKALLTAGCGGSW